MKPTKFWFEKCHEFLKLINIWLKYEPLNVGYLISKSTFLYINLSLNISLKRNLWNQNNEFQHSADLLNLYLNMVKEIKGENLGTGILYFSDFLYKMTRAGKAGEFLPCERMFICQLRLAGDKSPILGRSSWRGLGHEFVFSALLRNVSRFRMRNLIRFLFWNFWGDHFLKIGWGMYLDSSPKILRAGIETFLEGEEKSTLGVSDSNYFFIHL